MGIKAFAFSAAMVLLSPLAHAEIVASTLSDRLIGYAVLESKTIDRWYDSDHKEESSFLGCKPGRVVVFSDNTALICTGNYFRYANRPKAVVLYRLDSYKYAGLPPVKMVVGDDVYDMKQYGY